MMGGELQGGRVVNDSTVTATVSFFVFPVVVAVLAWLVWSHDRRR